MMSTTFSWPLLLWPIAAFISGLLAGVLHFTALHHVVERFVGGAVGMALALQCLRLVLLAALLVAFATAGLSALLAGFAGLLVARYFVVQRAGSISR